MRSRLGGAIASFLVMEPLTYAAHRWVMHGVGWALHASHHRGRVSDLQARASALEANDAFPCIFASFTMLGMAAGRGRPAPLSVGFGVTAYGAAYALVHDVYIHARLGPRPRLKVLERLENAHRLHHLYGGEPYGMLFPVVPARLKAKAGA